MGLEKNVVNQQTANKALTGERIRRKLLRANVIHPTENPQSEVVFQELSGLGLILAVQNRVTHTWTSSANARLVCPSTPPLVLNDVKKKANRKQRWLQTALLSLPLYINLLYHRIAVCQELIHDFCPVTLPLPVPALNTISPFSFNGHTV